MFRYYLLGSDTVAPSGLYTGLCHALLVVAFSLNSFESVSCVCTCEGYGVGRDSNGVRAVPGGLPDVRRDRARAVLGRSVDVSRSARLHHP